MAVWGGRRCDRLPPVARRQPRPGSTVCVASNEQIWCASLRGMRSGDFVSDIFREIDDELRRENLVQLWSRYSRYIIAAAVLLGLIVGGIFAWRQYLASERLAPAKRYTAALALARQNQEEEAVKLFATLANGGGYGIPAGF